jgi:hypothetical protein
MREIVHALGSVNGQSFAACREMVFISQRQCALNRFHVRSTVDVTGFPGIFIIKTSFNVYIGQDGFATLFHTSSGFSRVNWTPTG